MSRGKLLDLSITAVVSGIGYWLGGPWLGALLFIAGLIGFMLYWQTREIHVESVMPKRDDWADSSTLALFRLFLEKSRRR